MEPSRTASPPQSRWQKRVWIVLAILGVLLVRLFVVKTYRIPAGSMEPTIQIGDHILAISQIAYLNQAPQRGALVVYRYPKDPRREFIHRVVAVGGDQIEIRDKQLFINGQVVEEPYVVHTDPVTLSSYYSPSSRRDQMSPQPVPDGSFFVLGDNRDNSNDSRFWGPVDGALITGRPQFVYWSYDRDSGEVRWDRIGRGLD